MRKKSLSLMLAASLISNMFPVGVRAVGYNFSTPTGNLLVRELKGRISKLGKLSNYCYEPQEASEDIKLNLQQGEGNNVFVLQVTEDYLKGTGIDTREPENCYLGTGRGQTNRPQDYKIEAHFTKGGNVVEFRALQGYGHLRITPKIGHIEPIAISFNSVSSAIFRVTENEEVEGYIEITGAGAPQQIHFSGVVQPGITGPKVPRGTNTTAQKQQQQKQQAPNTNAECSCKPAANPPAACIDTEGKYPIAEQLHGLSFDTSRGNLIVHKVNPDGSIGEGSYSIKLDCKLNKEQKFIIEVGNDALGRMGLKYTSEIKWLGADLEANNFDAYSFKLAPDSPLKFDVKKRNCYLGGPEGKMVRVIELSFKNSIDDCFARGALWIKTCDKDGAPYGERQIIYVEDVNRQSWAISGSFHREYRALPLYIREKRAPFLDTDAPLVLS